MFHENEWENPTEKIKTKVKNHQTGKKLYFIEY